MAAVAAYIELNPVRAGLCADPKDYRYSGYAEALAKGSLLARQGIRTILGQPETISWKELSGEYRKYLFVKGSSRSANKPLAFDLATAQRVVEEQNGELPLAQRLLCRIRYFTDGVILGSQDFVESHFSRLKQKAWLQAPPDRDLFNRSGFCGPLGLPRSAGPSVRLGCCRFRLPATVIRSYFSHL